MKTAIEAPSRRVERSDGETRVEIAMRDANAPYANVERTAPGDENVTLPARYASHIKAIDVTSNPKLRLWHMCAARGLYRLMVDIEISGGEPCPAGMPHVLCISDEQIRCVV